MSGQKFPGRSNNDNRRRQASSKVVGSPLKVGEAARAVRDGNLKRVVADHHPQGLAKWADISRFIRSDALGVGG